MRPGDSIAGRTAVVAGLTLAGCLGAPSSNTGEDLTAREVWNTKAWPVLSAGCAGCHGAQPAIDFLAPNTSEGAYETVFEFQPPVLDIEAPAASLLLTMGKHTGPGLAGASAAAVLEWLEAERDERAPDVGTTTRIGPILPAMGTPFVLDLGVGGANLTLMMTSSESGLYVSQATINAGTGVRLAHPLFVSRPPHPVVDAIDRFSDIDTSLTQGQTLELGPAWFLEFNPADYLSIHFATLEAPQ